MKEITRAFVKTFNRCPICDLDFVDHYFSLLSMIPAYKAEEVTALIDKVKNHQWAAACEIREFDGAEDIIEIYVLRCPSRRWGVVIMEDPVELFYNPSILDYEVLDEALSEELRAVMRNTQWLSIDSIK